MRVLRHRGFAAFFTAAAISNGGSWMQTVAVPALLFDLTHQATWLGYSSIATLIPAVILTPYAGVLCDRVSRRKILVVTQVVQMAAAFTMWILFQGGDLTPWRILGLGFLSGVAAGFQSSAWQSFIPLLVPPEDMLDAVKLNSMQFTLARAIGPGFAGIVVATWGTGAAILVNTVTYPLVIAVLLLSNPRQNSIASRHESVIDSLIGGGRFVWRNRPIRLAIGIAFISAVAGQSLQHVSAAISSRVYDRPSTDNAGLLAVLGIGALGASALHALGGHRLRRSQFTMLGLWLYVISAGLIPLTSIYAVGLLAYFVAGFGHLTMAIALNTLIQGRTPDEMRGRTMSYYLFGILLGIPVGAFLLGRMADVWSMQTALWADVGMVLAMVAWLKLTGALALFDDDNTSGG